MEKSEEWSVKIIATNRATETQTDKQKTMTDRMAKSMNAKRSKVAPIVLMT